MDVIRASPGYIAYLGNGIRPRTSILPDYGVTVRMDSEAALCLPTLNAVQDSGLLIIVSGELYCRYRHQGVFCAQVR